MDNFHKPCAIQTEMKPIPIDSSHRADHEYARDFGRNVTNKKVMRFQNFEKTIGGTLWSKRVKNLFFPKNT